MIRSPRSIRVAAVVFACASWGMAADAQQISGPRAGTPSPVPSRGMELGITGLFGAPVVYGETSADLIAPDGSTLALFSASKRQAPEYGLRMHAGGPVRSAFFGEVGGSVSRIKFETRLTDDLEGASDVLASVDGWRFVVDGGVGWNVWRNSAASIFIRGSAGWTRDAVDSGADMQDGPIATVGAGMKYWKSRANPRKLRYGIRLDGQLAARWNGVGLDSRTVQLAPVFTAGLIIGS